MLPQLCYALSFLPPTDAERREMAHLYPQVNARWNQKMDRASVVVTVRDAGLLIAAGIVHDSIVAPTELMDAVELGCMSVDPRYRRMGIRQHVTSLRLEHALRAGANPITVIYAGNPASWAFYERSDLWSLEREYEYDQQRLFIYQTTPLAKQWVHQLPHAAEVSQDPRKSQLAVQLPLDQATGTPLAAPSTAAQSSSSLIAKNQGTDAGFGLEPVAG